MPESNTTENNQNNCNLYQSIFEDAPAAQFVTDLEGSISLMNQAARQLLQWKSDNKEQIKMNDSSKCRYRNLNTNRLRRTPKKGGS